MTDFDVLTKAIEKWDKYYTANYHWRNTHVMETMISELLISPHVELRMKHFQLLGAILPFDIDNCRIFISGIPSRVYTKEYDWTYIDGSVFFYDRVLPFYMDELKARGFKGFAFIDVRGADGYNDKNLVFVFTPLYKDSSAKALVRCITDFLQKQYEGLLPGYSRYIACFSILSREVKDCHRLSEMFFEAADLKKLAFFIMRPEVFTPEDYARQHKRLDEFMLNEYCQRLSAAVYSGDCDGCKDVLSELFLDRIKTSLDFYAFDYSLNFCSYVFSKACITYRIPMGRRMERRDFYNVEQCLEALIEEARRITTAIGIAGAGLSYITREALCYIHSHYQEAISLKNIAQSINVVPSYISRVFSSEMGENVVKYINSLRIAKAKELLVTTDAKVKDVAERVGIFNVKYMIRMFRSYEGLSPQEYRKNILGPKGKP